MPLGPGTRGEEGGAGQQSSVRCLSPAYFFLPVGQFGFKLAPRRQKSKSAKIAREAGSLCARYVG